MVEDKKKPIYIIFCPKCNEKIIFDIDENKDFIGTKKNKPKKIV